MKEERIINTIPSLHKLNDFKEFSFEFVQSENNNYFNLLKSSGINIKIQGGMHEIYYQSGLINYKLASFNKKEVLIYPPSASLVPLYYRLFKGKIIISNVIENLIIANENLEIDNLGLTECLSRGKCINMNLFKKIKCLAPLCQYIFSNGKLTFKKLLVNKKSKNINDALENIYSQYDELFKSKKDVYIFMTAGYDSRTNLALAYKYSLKYGNKITLVRIKTTEVEYERNSPSCIQETKEDKIVNEIANDLELSIINYKIDPKISTDFNNIISQDERYIRMYPNIPRPGTWNFFLVLNDIKKFNPDSIIIGIQTDCHKGIGYKLVKNINKDYKLIGAIGKRYSKYLSRFFGYSVSLEDQIKIVLESNMRSINLDFYSRIDYYHYDTYTKWFGPDRGVFQSLFNIPYPFLDKDFLDILFNLKKDEKENANICREIIQRCLPKLNDYSLHSGSWRGYLKRKNFLMKLYAFASFKFKNTLIDLGLLNNDKRIIEIERSSINNSDFKAIKWKSKNDVVNKILDYCFEYKTYNKNIPIVSSQSVVLKLKYIEEKYSVNFVL